MSTLKRLMVEIGIDLSGLADAGAKGEILGREAGDRAGAG